MEYFKKQDEIDEIFVELLNNLDDTVEKVSNQSIQTSKCKEYHRMPVLETIIALLFMGRNDE